MGLEGDMSALCLEVLIIVMVGISKNVRHFSIRYNCVVATQRHAQKYYRWSLSATHARKCYVLALFPDSSTPERELKLCMRRAQSLAWYFSHMRTLKDGKAVYVCG